MRNPPLARITASRLNMPKAPETMSSIFNADCAIRPARNARRYSTTCRPASRFPGSRTSTTRPRSTFDPLTIRTMPPAATVSGFSRKGRTARDSACSSRSESASMTQTRGASRRVDAGVDRIGLAAVLLVDQNEVVATDGAIDAADGPSRDWLFVGRGGADQVEGADRDIQRAIPGTVVDQDHFEQRVIQQKQRTNTFGDGRFFVARGRDNRDPGGRG